MTVIETKIPIEVVVQTKNPQSSFICCTICNSACRYFSHDIPVRAIPLCNSDCNNDGMSNTIMQHQMPTQLIDVMTSDIYNEFCMKINDLIRQHDEADTQRTKYAETNVKILNAMALTTLFLALALLSNVIFSSDKDDTAATVTNDILYRFMFGVFGTIVVLFLSYCFERLYYRYYNDVIMKYISLQKIAYETIQRECEILSSNISTPLVATITLYLGYSKEDYDKKCNKYRRYYDRNSQAWLKLTQFDHVVVTTTNIVVQPLDMDDRPEADEQDLV